MTQRATTETKLRTRIRELERRIDSLETGLITTILPTAFLQAVADMASLAVYGTRRPDDLATTPTHPASRPPIGSEEAAAHLLTLTRQLVKIATELDQKARHIDQPRGAA